MRVRTEAGVRAYPVPPLGLLDEQHVLETHTVGKVEEPLAGNAGPRVTEGSHTLLLHTIKCLDGT